jgi:hypothetical protein
VIIPDQLTHFQSYYYSRLLLSPVTLVQD